MAALHKILGQGKTARLGGDFLQDMARHTRKHHASRVLARETINKY
jgi:hypothetical protein